jgi:hypothetical protein
MCQLARWAPQLGIPCCRHSWLQHVWTSVRGLRMLGPPPGVQWRPQWPHMEAPHVRPSPRGCPRCMPPPTCVPTSHRGSSALDRPAQVAASRMLGCAMGDAWSRPCMPAGLQLQVPGRRPAGGQQLPGRCQLVPARCPAGARQMPSRCPSEAQLEPGRCRAGARQMHGLPADHTWRFTASRGGAVCRCI